MAVRRYIQSAAPYASINSTCFVASVELNHTYHKSLVPVYLPTGEGMPTTQAKTLDLIQQVDIPADQVTVETTGIKFAADNVSGSIDGAVADYRWHFHQGAQTETESI